MYLLFLYSASSLSFRIAFHLQNHRIVSVPLILYNPLSVYLSFTYSFIHRLSSYLEFVPVSLLYLTACLAVDDIVSSSCVALKRKSIKSEYVGYLTQSYVPDRTISSLVCGWILEADVGHRIQIDLYYFAQVVSTDRSVHSTSGGSDATFVCRRLAKIKDKQSGKETNICATKDRVRNVFKSDSHSLEIILTGRQESSHDPHFIFKYEGLYSFTKFYLFIACLLFVPCAMFLCMLHTRAHTDIHKGIYIIAYIHHVCMREFM